MKATDKTHLPATPLLRETMQTAELARSAEIAPITPSPLQRVETDAREQTRPS